MPAREFHDGPYETVVGPAEILTEVRVPIRPGAGSAYEKVERRAGDWAIAAAGAFVMLDGDTVGDVRHRADRRGRRPTSAPRRPRTPCGASRPPRRTWPRPPQAAARRRATRRPTSAGPADYKRHLAGELTLRALRRSVARARGEGPDMQVTMTVNGDEVTRDVEPRLLLVHFLRDHLGLTGTHWGCDTSNCGTCVVWMDGEPVKSCTVLAAMADGRDGPHGRGPRQRRRARPGPAGLHA